VAKLADLGTALCLLPGAGAGVGVGGEEEGPLWSARVSGW
jgi:hypothetical protein